jgi:hypothetical protein
MRGILSCRRISESQQELPNQDKACKKPSGFFFFAFGVLTFFGSGFLSLVVVDGMRK